MGNGAAQQRAQMFEMLRQALSTMGGAGNPGGMTPEALMELARRAGISNPAQIAGLQNIMSMEGGARDATPKAPQHIIFVLGDIECALPAEAVQGVERLGEVTSVPNTASWVMGITQAVGMIVSVVDLRAFLGVPSLGVTTQSRLMVVSRREMTIGFLVDAVMEMRPLGEVIGQGDPQMMRRAPDWVRPYIADTAQFDGRVIAMLDPDQLVFNEHIHRYRLGA
jgi:purine-binding chemotaxis protein CheW